MKSISHHHQATLELTVTPEMTVRFDELGGVHPVYATYQMARHFEEAGRKLLLPHLEPGEEGIGTKVSVEHLGSALVGMRVTVTATFAALEGRRLTCALEAVNELSDVIGRGSTEQYVTRRERIEENFAALEARWRDAKEKSGG